MKTHSSLHREHPWLALGHRVLVGTIVFLILLAAGVQIARGAEIIPSVSITRAVDGDAGSAQLSGGLALRGSVAPFLLGEVGVSYRNERRFGGELRIEQWPVTASLWLKPLPLLYAGGGAGWYRTTLDYAADQPWSDSVQQKFGAHLAGGARLPIVPMASLDLQGRYVFLGDLETRLSPTHLNPDFWTTSVGLAISF